MNGISTLPPETRAGLDFDYSQWHPDSEITLCTVPWANSYDSVVEFQSNAKLNEYIDKLPNTRKLKIGMMTYVSPSNPIKIDLPHNAANVYNYMRVRNPKQPVNGDVQRDFYYFILNTSRLAAMTTEMHVQLDVWQSYRRLVKFLRGYIDTGHIGVANYMQDEDSGRKWLTTVEGLDTGSEYMTSRVFNIGDFPDYDVLLTATSNLVSPPGTVAAPKLSTTPGGTMQGIPTATTTYRIAANNLSSYMGAMSGYPWVTQGIIRVVLVPKLSRLGVTTSPVTRDNNYPPGPSGSSSSYLERFVSAPSHKSQVNFSPSGYQDERMNVLPDRYKYLRKFATSPYMFIEVSTGFGDSFTYRPELFPKGVTKADVGFCLLPGAERLEFSIREYNARYQGSYADQYSAAVSLGNFPTLPVVNNMAISALAAGAHSRNATRANAAWGAQLAYAGADASYSNAQLGASTAYNNELASQGLSADLLMMQQGTARSNAQLGIAGSVLGGAVGGGINGGVGPGGSLKGMGAGAALGAASGGANAVISAQQLMNTQASERRQLQASLNTGAANMNRTYDATMGMAETNKGLAEYAADGNYQAAIRSTNAAVQDTMLTQPGMSGQYGGEFLRTLQKGFTFEARLKVLDPGATERIGEYWLRYGYKVNTFAKLDDNLMVMSKFSYWKLNEVFISAANVPEVFKQALRGILERGTTVWASPDMIGNTDPGTNVPKPNITIRNGV